MKKIIKLLLMFMLIAVISNAQDDNKIVKLGDVEGYTMVEVMPEFKGGSGAMFKYLADSVKYPKSARKAKEEGTVYIQFIIDAQGKIVNPKVLKGTYPDLNEEALRVISGMPDWIPGKQEGKNVNVAFTVPIKFVL